MHGSPTYTISTKGPSLIDVKSKQEKRGYPKMALKGDFVYKIKWLVDNSKKVNFKYGGFHIKHSYFFLNDILGELALVQLFKNENVG